MDDNDFFGPILALPLFDFDTAIVRIFRAYEAYFHFGFC
jgi:hypothetical protein